VSSAGRVQERSSNVAGKAFLSAFALNILFCAHERALRLLDIGDVVRAQSRCCLPRIRGGEL
jgi:hypothetical protein